MSIDQPIRIKGGTAYNLQNVDVEFEREKITVVTGVSGSGKSSLVFDTLLAQAKHHFFNTLPHFQRGLFHFGEPVQARQITGLSLAIALEQAETAPSPRATVATLTNIGELLGVLWSRFSSKYCPTHHEICATSVSPREVAQQVCRDFDQGEQVAIMAPTVEHKMGLFRKEIYCARAEGCAYISINGQLYDLNAKLPDFHPRKKYTLKVLVRQMVIHPESMENLTDSIAAAAGLGGGYVEVVPSGGAADGWPEFHGQQLAHPKKYSLHAGCPQCGFTWPPLDSRYFSQNSLGRCPECDGFGTLHDATDVGVDSHLYQHGHSHCHHCDGTGLNPDFDPVTLAGRSLRSTYLLELDELADVVVSLVTSLVVASKNDALWIVLEELRHEIERVQQLGLGHLQLARRILSLSHGERQRLRLSSILTEPLSGVLYVLDEPSQGLHPADLESIWANIELLRSLGNTIIVVDHDEFCWRQADRIVELGPGGGAGGGAIIASFKPSQAEQWRTRSLTARILCEQASGRERQLPAKGSGRDAAAHGANEAKFIAFEDVNYRYLAMPQVRIKQAALNVVCGVSGVGKTSLVMGVMAENLRRWQQAHRMVKQRVGVVGGAELSYRPFGCRAMVGAPPDMRVVVVDRKPLAKSSVSMPATYLDCMGSLRDLYAALPAAQLVGLTRQHFSLMHSLGRCGRCEGRGYIKHVMKFLAPTTEICPDCRGQRYQQMVLDIRYKGHSIAELLQLSLQEVADIFQHHRRIAKCLAPALGLGLGYLRFGQPSGSLSGGEAQRLKLATYLKSQSKQAQVLIIDEPTRGLHHEDVGFLNATLQQITGQGVTIVLVEHHSEVLNNVDWLIDLGHGGGRAGGQMIYEGDLTGFYDLFQHSPGQSLTARHLFD